MMTIHKLSAGDGFRYYTRETATADVPREGKRELGDYYTADGNPPGLWVGSGIELLGVSGTVTEAQMRALFGEGLHPNAEQIIAERLAAGDKPTDATRAARLGRRYYQYEARDGEFARQLDAAMADLERREHRPVSPEEQTTLRGRVGAQMFREQHGRNPLTRTELGQFISAQGGKGPTAVAGFDLVFTAPKSVSVLWGLGDNATRIAVEQAHEKAIADTLRWIEQHALMTRTGVNGIAQEDIVGGLVATRFRHYDSRLGDPLLHDHVVVANKVQGRDGKWRSIDGKLLLQMNVPASEHYNQRVVEEVAAALGLAAQAREVTPGKRPVMEIAGIPTDMIEAASQRSADIRARVDELLHAYVDQHGYEPSPKTRMSLMQQATLETRPDKPHAQSLAELRDRWRTAAVEAFGADRVDHLLERARNAARAVRRATHPVDVDALAATVIDTVSEHRSVWRRSHVLAEARRQVVAATRGTSTTDALAEQVTDRALATGSIDITPPDPNPLFGPLTRADGTSIYRRRDSELYTSAAVLAAEELVVAAAKADVIPAVSPEVFQRTLADHTGPLDASQRHMAEAFATSEKLVTGWIGPAGTGKTTALRLVAEAVRAQGGRVIGLGPSAQAAHIMSAEIHTEAFTLHAWLAARQRIADGGDVEDTYRLRPGDVVLIDESGMAGTRRIAEVVRDARHAGAHVRLLGDPSQLAAVEAGGLLRWLAQQGLVGHLDTVHRFQTPGEGPASLRLRDGDVGDAFTWYRRHHRVVGGTYEQMVDQLFERWQRDNDNGLTAMMMAEDNTTVADLNERAQTRRMSHGQLSGEHTAQLRGTEQAWTGDLLLTRRNRRRWTLRGGRDFVKNGDLWHVRTVYPDGSATVQHTDHGGRIRLDAAYLRDHTQLGYAGTGHRGQGATVDAGAGLATARTSRESAYVFLTRGRSDNRLFVVLDKGETVDDALARIAANSQASRSAHETIRAEQDRAWGIGQLAAEYTDAHTRALAMRYQALARTLLGDRTAQMFIASEAWGAVERALYDAEQAGFDPGGILSAAYSEREFATADDASAVLSWRIDRRVEEGLEARDNATAQAAEHPGSRPLADYAQERLDELGEQTRVQRADALLELQQAEARVAAQPRPVTASGLPHPAWPDRRHGGLTRQELADHLALARRDARREGDPEHVHAAARRAAELRAEQQLRHAMPPLDHAREDWQREVSTAPVGVPERTTQLHDVDRAQEALRRAELIADQVAAEQRLRRKLPDLPDQAVAAQVDHTGPLPTWLAPIQAQTDHAYTPADWRDHLDERRQIMAVRLQNTGEALAADAPAWARPLGPVPPESHPLRGRWQHTAALVDAWRTRTHVPGTLPGLGPEPTDEHQAQAWHALKAELNDVGRRARAVAAAAERGNQHTERDEEQPAATGWRAAARADTRAAAPSWRRTHDPAADTAGRDQERRRRDEQQRGGDRGEAPER
jgi:conjugative relaxase-like TrwC/TraI family protein